jgi:hypothetical protein
MACEDEWRGVRNAEVKLSGVRRVGACERVVACEGPVPHVCAALQCPVDRTQMRIRRRVRRDHHRRHVPQWIHRIELIDAPILEQLVDVNGGWVRLETNKRKHTCG